MVLSITILTLSLAEKGHRNNQDEDCKSQKFHFLFIFYVKHARNFYLFFL